MRRALWIFSAPVVAGGLAWAVNAANDVGPLLAGAPQAQNGKIIYFSRGGKPAAAPSDADAASADDSAADDAAQSDAPATPQRYVRNRPATGATTVTNTPTESGSVAASGTKNYKDLFANESRATATRQTAARTASKAVAASTKANKQAILEECGIDDATDADSAREEVKLPPVASAKKSAAGKTQQVAGIRDGAGVRHAELRSGDAVAKRGVRPIQHTAAPAGPPADEDDADLEAPVAPQKTVRKEAPVKAARPVASAVKPAASAQARQIRKPLIAAPKTRQTITQTAADDARETSAVATGTGTTDGQAITAAASDDVPMVALRWTKIDEVNVNQECKCGLVVKNSGKMVAKDIVVEAYFPRTVRLIDANPFPNDSKDHLVWI